VLEAAGLTYEELRQTNPRLVYLQVTGYGPEGPDRDRAAYDVGAFWSRAGVAAALTPQGADFPQQRGGMGDHMAGTSAAGAICAALLARERTGEGQRLNVSLIRVGVYFMGWDVSLALRLRLPIEAYDRCHAINPLIDCFQAGDGRWFWLLHLQGDRHWPNVCRAVGREDLIADPRFGTTGMRWLNAPALVEELDRAFATKSMAEWAEVFDQNDVWWAPINSINEVLHDPVAHEAGAFTEAAGPEGPVPMVSTPVDFYGTPWQAQGIAPELGQHTEEVLLELGHDWDQIIALKEGGAIP
jgi:crotonobetainyl-CoA:carnitine CoA-transferase CaiB-like acyl-CoA transferase